MPRYFFNVHDGKDLPDHYGTELRDREAAHKEAVFAAGEMLKETGREFLRDDVWENARHRRSRRDSLPAQVLG